MDLYMQGHVKKAGQVYSICWKKLHLSYYSIGQMVFLCPEEQMNTDFMQESYYHIFHFFTLFMHKIIFLWVSF